MAYDAFMWLKGGAPEASGETTDKEFKSDKAFEIYSFSFGASNPVTIGSATAGSGGGKVSISSFNVMKKTDSASPALFLNCAKGQHFIAVVDYGRAINCGQARHSFNRATHRGFPNAFAQTSQILLNQIRQPREMRRD